MTHVQRLAQFVDDASYSDLSDEAARRLKVRVLDSLGCAIGALDGEPIRMLRAHLADFGGTEHATLIGGGRTAPDRAALYPTTLHGLTALIYGLVGAASRENLSTAIDILADLRGLGGRSYSGLPVSELASFGFELLIGRALEKGWEEVFAESPDYAAYAAERQAAGLP